MTEPTTTKMSFVTETVTPVHDLAYESSFDESPITVKEPTCPSYDSSTAGLPVEDMEKLKDHIRCLQGLPLKFADRRNRINYSKPPIISPKANRTQQRRIDLQNYRIERNIENMMFDIDELVDEKKDDEEFLQLIRTLAKAKTCEELRQEEEFIQFENLKRLSLMARSRQQPNYRENRNSEFRMMALRREPLISSHFRQTFDEHGKSPFFIPRKYEPPRAFQIPKIESKNEVWYYPFDDSEGIPLHYQQKPSPKVKLTQKQRSRPPVKPGHRTHLAEWKAKKNAGKTNKKKPWHFG